MEKRKKLLPVLLLIIIIAVVIYYFVGRSSGSLYGEVEAVVYSQITEVSGLLLEVSVEPGQKIEKGAEIAVIDSTNQMHALEQLELTLETQKLALSEAQTQGGTQAANGLTVAKANYNSAVSAAIKANSDYQAARDLYEEGAISKDALEKAKVQTDAAENASAAAKAQMNNAANSSSAESLELGIAQLEIQIQQAKETLEKYTITADHSGIIMSKNYYTGDMVSPGYSLVDISSDEEKYFVFYLPKEVLGDIGYDDVVTISSNDKEYEGIVKYIDVKSEYTPKDFQTAANKNKTSVKIKLLLPKDCPLKPAENGTVRI